jgi:hypothetical protein
MCRYTICSLLPLHKKIPIFKFQQTPIHNIIHLRHFCRFFKCAILCHNSWLRSLLHSQVLPLRVQPAYVYALYIFYVYDKMNYKRPFPHFWRSSTMLVTAVHPDRINQSPLKEFSQKLIFENFTKNLKKLYIFLLSDEDNVHFT